jgi:putative endonuclease
VGSCQDFKRRFEDHLARTYPNSFTSNSDDWKVFLLVEKLTYAEARSMEAHIKKMKSKQYISNLGKYPEMIAKLKNRYRE